MALASKEPVTTEVVVRRLEQIFHRTRSQYSEVRRFGKFEPCVAPSTEGLSITFKDGSVFKIAVLRYELPSE